MSKYVCVKQLLEVLKPTLRTWRSVEDMEPRVDGGHDSQDTSAGSEPLPSQNPAPPKITPYSGVLGKGKEVIRPIAFKPVSRMLDNSVERYSSVGDLRQHGSRLFSSPPLSSLPTTSSCSKMLTCDSLESVTNISGEKSSCGSLLDLTPSPSDRDSELASLRQTMEHNEQVIFRVYQEKERIWERELRRIKSVHENRLRAGAQKALKLEQMLMMQTYQLQQDKKRLKEEAAELRQEVELLRGRLEETEWGLCEKTGELSLLKAQLKDTQATKGQELVQLRSQVRDLKAELEKTKEDNLALVQDKDREEQLRQEVERLGSQLAQERADFDRERIIWAQEKEKVLRYQRQLQLNYVQMFRRTRTLEAEVESLTLELELEMKGAAIKKHLPAIEMGHTIQL